MNRIRIISSIFKKQFKDTLKNMPVLILFFVYPIIAIIMSSSISSSFGEATFFISVFSTMHCIFTPIVATAAIISEEKEKNTLRTLIMSNVKSTDYLLSIGGFIFLCTLISSLLFIPAGGFTFESTVKFMMFMAVGSSCSIILGLTIGGFSKNMSGANAIAVPISMVFSFLPMLSSFNEKIAQISKFTYGYQISQMISESNFRLNTFSVAVISVNLMIFISAFIFIFRKNKLEN